MNARPHWPTAIFGLALAGFALVMLAAAFAVPLRASDRLYGPRLFPVAVMAGLAALALAIAWEGFRRGAAEGVERSPMRRRGGALVLLGLALFALLVEPLGFIVASAALFAAVTHAFLPGLGARALVPALARDLAIGLVIAGLAFVVFTRGLGLALPSGTVFDALFLRPGG